MLNPTVKALWINALRDPSNKQTKGVLKDDTGFCCLGLLSHLHDPCIWQEAEEARALLTPEFTTAYRHGQDGSLYLPSKDVKEWAGFPMEDGARTIPRVTINGEHLRLNAHNDAGRTFPEIAKAIEEQL